MTEEEEKEWPEKNFTIKQVYEELRVLQKRRIDVWTRKATLVTALLGVGSLKLGGAVAWPTAFLAPLVTLLFDFQLMNTSIAIKRARYFLWEKSTPESLERDWSVYLNCDKNKTGFTEQVADGFTAAVYVASTLILLFASMSLSLWGCVVFLFMFVIYAVYCAVLIILYWDARRIEKAGKRRFRVPSTTCEECEYKCGL